MEDASIIKKEKAITKRTFTRKNPTPEIDKRIFEFMSKLKGDGRIRFDTDFARSIGMLKQELNNIKRGTQSFTVMHIQKICDNYRMNPAWLFGYENLMFRRYKVKIESENLSLPPQNITGG